MKKDIEQERKYTQTNDIRKTLTAPTNI